MHEFLIFWELVVIAVGLAKKQLQFSFVNWSICQKSNGKCVLGTKRWVCSSTHLSSEIENFASLRNWWSCKLSATEDVTTCRNRRFCKLLEIQFLASFQTLKLPQAFRKLFKIWGIASFWKLKIAQALRNSVVTSLWKLTLEIEVPASF